ncbi:MAG: AAA family ATPase [Atopobiaceae bacterium]|nr:AAA family ATPase [Atopobiaceae bacterium]
MGKYLNPGTAQFRRSLRSEIYVDKSAMLSFTNSVVGTRRCYLCVSRPRRFGKTMTADMLCAYYGLGDDARGLFADLRLAQTEPTRAGDATLPWDAYLGSFDVVRLTVTEFLKRGKTVAECLDRMQRLVMRDIVRAYPNVDYFDTSDLIQGMQDVYDETGRQFVIVIDEWDAPMRERQGDEDYQRIYLDFLRDWLKDHAFVALAYMTGILPIKKYGVHSALNMFDEYSMTSPKQLAEYTGFTETEVRELCMGFHMDFEAIRTWYDGYEVTGILPLEKRAFEKEPPRWSLYTPLSVANAVITGRIENYWNGTESYEALAKYIRMDFDGLKETTALLMDGGRVPVELGTYQNDMDNFTGRDDVLALLIHLGYLGWDDMAKEAFVPNREVMDVFRASTKSSEWEAPLREYELSKKLLLATWAKDAETVAALLEDAHNRTENRTYHGEAALSYAIQLAYYAAQKYYTVIPELDSGQGYADVAYLPSPRYADKPALMVELKWNKNARTALDQIHDRNYPERLAHYRGNLLLIGISYERNIRAGASGYKHHSCVIEQV